ncbi:MAG TPA: hypothetical protein VK009_08195 [Chloroflexota bacterium]|nr:hypothetical protein [Chloroflexota bacterium]
MQSDPFELESVSATHVEAAEAETGAGFDDVDVRDLLMEAGRTWQVLQHDLDSQWRRPRA